MQGYGSDAMKGGDAHFQKVVVTVSSDPIDVATIDPLDAAAFDEWFGVWHHIDGEIWPDTPGWQRAERLGRGLDDGPEQHRCLVARRRDELVGIADFETYRRENEHVARLNVRVLPAHRRQGVGTAIVEAATRFAQAEGRTELGGTDETPVRAGFVDAAGPFARHLGFAPALSMVRRGLRLPLSTERARQLRDDPRATPRGYSLLTWTDRWPDEYLEDRCEFGRRMSTDVPTGEQELDEEKWDADRVRALEASVAAQDRTKLTTVARDDATGRLVAFSEIAVPRRAPESVWQLDTLVVREHRGHALGFATKVANLWGLLERHPATRTVNTWNAAENEHMIAVNEAIGFEVDARSVSWRKLLEA
jgi:RimJ/RimL family protein N-acetyltransferase